MEENRKSDLTYFSLIQFLFFGSDFISQNEHIGGFYHPNFRYLGLFIVSMELCSICIVDLVNNSLLPSQLLVGRRTLFLEQRVCFLFINYLPVP
jgi:hypothetical protein